MPTAGYSGTPLVRKLGLRAGFRAAVAGAPADYRRLLAPEPEAVRWLGARARDLDFVHLFVRRERDLAAALPRHLRRIVPAGMIWVSWPKKASQVPTDVTEDVVRRHALPLGLVDVKVCAIDVVWSGLKLVVRLKNR
jgi:hypothetical protein